MKAYHHPQRDPATGAIGHWEDYPVHVLMEDGVESFHSVFIRHCQVHVHEVPPCSACASHGGADAV